MSDGHETRGLNVATQFGVLLTNRPDKLGKGLAALLLVLDDFHLMILQLV